MSAIIVDALVAYATPERRRPGAGGVHVVRVAEGLWRLAEARADRDEVAMDTVIEAGLIGYATPPPVTFPIKMPLRPGCYDVDWPSKGGESATGRTS